MNYLYSRNNILARVAEAALQLVFPLSTYCLCCGKPVNSTRSYSICDHCIHRIRWGNIVIDLEAESRRLGRASHLDSAAACMKYGLYERRLIFDLKYDGRTYVARAIGKIMADRLAAQGGGPVDTGGPGGPACPDGQNGPARLGGGFDLLCRLAAVELFKTCACLFELCVDGGAHFCGFCHFHACRFVGV